MLALLILAFALAMDAFAVSIVRGSVGPHRISEGFRIALAFGIAQGIMPLIGWWLGIAFADDFKRFDHWIAFVLLAVLGVRMIREGLSAPETSPEDDKPGSPILSLVVAAFATSIDAAAAGLALPLLGMAVPIACLTIGATTAVLCFIGYLIGGRASLSLGKRAEVLGGLILIGLGFRILIAHALLGG